MSIKTMRFPKEIDAAMAFVAQREKIEKSQSLRKLAAMGFEAYLARLYAEGKLSLREVATRLKRSLSETLDLMNEFGVTGNISSSDVMASLEVLGSELDTEH